MKLKFRQGDSYVLLAMLIFGTYPLFLRFFPNISSITFLVAFQIVGALAFLLLQYKKGFPKVERTQIILLASLAFVALGNDLAYFLSFRLTTVANAALGHQMVSVFLVFLASIFLKEKVKQKEYLALIVALLGILVIYYPGLQVNKKEDLIGISLSLLSAIFYAFLIIHYRLLSKKLSITTINLFRYLISIILLLPFIFLYDGFKISTDQIPILTAFGILFAVIASGIHSFGMSQTRALHVSIIGKAEPVIASCYAYLFLHEVPSLEAIFGGSLIIGASFYLALSEDSG